MIAYTCPGCGARMESPLSLAGGTERCPQCGTLTSVPAASRREAATKPWPALCHWVLAACFALPLSTVFATALALKHSETQYLHGQLAVRRAEAPSAQAASLSELYRSADSGRERAMAPTSAEPAATEAARWRDAASAERINAATAAADAQRWHGESEQRRATIAQLQEETEFLRSQLAEWQKLAMAVAAARAQPAAPFPVVHPRIAPESQQPVPEPPAAPPRPTKDTELAALEQSLSVAKAKGRAAVADRAQLRRQYDAEREAVEKAYQDRLLTIQRQYEEEAAAAPRRLPPESPPSGRDGQIVIIRAPSVPVPLRDISGAVQRRGQRISDAQAERDRALREIDSRYQPQVSAIDATIRRLEQEVTLLARKAAEIMAAPSR